MTCHAARRIPAPDVRRCDICALPITTSRLEATPWTRLCADCEEAARVSVVERERRYPCFAGLAGAGMTAGDP